MELEFGSKQSKSNTHEGYDPENESIPQEVKMRNLPKLQVFANELAEVIAVPPALQKIEPNGTAQLRINERDGRWEIAQAKGDPYFRALLYEAFLKLTPKTNGIIVLGASDFQSVRINLEFSSVSSVDQGLDPLKIKVNGNNISIAINYKVADPKWMMLMAGPSALPTVNLLGVAMILAKPYIEPNPRLDFDVRKLQLSPAFSKSIGK